MHVPEAPVQLPRLQDTLRLPEGKYCVLQPSVQLEFDRAGDTHEPALLFRIRGTADVQLFGWHDPVKPVQVPLLQVPVTLPDAV